MGHWGWGVGGWAGWLLMTLGVVVFCGAVLAMMVWVVRSPRSRQPEPPDEGPRRVLEILEERYARGEIDRQELEERRAVLQGKGS